MALDFMGAGQAAALCCSKGLQQVWPQKISLAAFGETCFMEYRFASNDWLKVFILF